MTPKPVIVPCGRARVGDVVMDDVGVYREIISITNADDVLKAYGERMPPGLYRGGHVAERNALFTRRNGRRGSED